MNPSAPSIPNRSIPEDVTESSLADEDLPMTPGGDPAAVPAADDKSAPTDRATGHYGPGYGDPTRHQGTDLPAGKESSTDR